jgi:pimeloyl-ACP methyl ester carboxylesterase
MVGGRQRTYVLVHGAWHGGWCWQMVAARLRRDGHRVTAPTLTGLGERAHHLSGAITLATFIDDICGHVSYEDLNDIVLVGHSFGGAVVSGVADRFAGTRRIARLIYLDAMLLESGQCPFDTLPPDIVAARKQAAQDQGQGIALPAPALEAFGIRDEAHRIWIGDRLTPHPLASFTTPLTLRHPLAAGLPVTYVTCTDPIYAPLATSRALAVRLGWPRRQMATGHDAMVIDPDGTADLLRDIVGGA